MPVDRERFTVEWVRHKGKNAGGSWQVFDTKKKGHWRHCFGVARKDIGTAVDANQELRAREMAARLNTQGA